MGISTFPAPSAGGGETNDFILDKNGTTNTTFSPGRAFAAGGYSVVVTGSTAYDIYLLNSSGSSVGYTNGTSIVASDAFEEISALGLGTADTVSFTYNGPSTNATTTGDETGAGAFLLSITPSDLPQIDDTAIVAGGNFASDVEVSFISGTVTKAAKNVVVGSSTALVVTRPDDLIEDFAPYDLKAINPGVTEPTGSGLSVLSGTVTVGTDPSFVTTSPILGTEQNVAISTAILASDAEGSVVSWEVTAGTLPTGLTLGTADGVFAGTPTTIGEFNFTVLITDEGGNTNSASFDMPVGTVVTAPNSTVVGGTTYAWFDSSDDFALVNAGTVTAEYLVIAGGGGGSRSGTGSLNDAGGGGGAGGLVFGTATLTDGTVTVTVGAGGGATANGENSVFGAFATAIGGGASEDVTTASSGGSGGGGAKFQNAGTAVDSGSQGNNGGNGSSAGAGGGGAGATGQNGGGTNGGAGGAGAAYSAWASAIGIVYDAGYFAGGGGGGANAGAGGAGGIGGGGNGRTDPTTEATNGSANSGGGGGGGAVDTGNSPANRPIGTGGSGLVVVRWT